MKHVNLLIFYILCAFLAGCSSENVYICTGLRSEVYHKTKNCTGLSGCSGEVKSVTKSEARDIGRRACKKCIE